MKKRIMSLAAAWLLLLSLMIPASAGKSNVTVITAMTQLPDVLVSVQSTGKVFINPYQLEVTVDYEEDEDAGTKTSQVVCEPAAIQNESLVPVTVSVTVAGTIKDGSDMSLATSSAAAVAQKKAFLYFEMQAVNPDTDLDRIQWAEAYDSSQHLVVRESEKTMKNIVTLSGVDANGDVSDGGVGAFHLAGDAAAANLKSSAKWTAADGVNVNIAFTFTPQAYEEPT